MQYDGGGSDSGVAQCGGQFGGASEQPGNHG
jgi:hypothetical protein